MLTENLFEKVLLAPAKKGYNQLCIVSGYSSPAIAFQQFEATPENIKISLIFGMSRGDGVAKPFHSGFKSLCEKYYPGRFECRYMVQLPPVHSKIYTWCTSDGIPREAYAGSLNYSQTAFFKYREAVTMAPPADCLAYYRSLLPQTIDCLDPNIEHAVQFYEQCRRPRRPSQEPAPLERSLTLDDINRAESVEISLLTERTGEPGERSGLNWGQRPEYKREPNQAYIPVPRRIAQANFLPPKGRHFTIVTDDGVSFDAVIAQDGDKAIETPHDNSIIGRYFRERMGIPLGAPVKKVDLERYGRTDIKISKLDDETYYLDFYSSNYAQKDHTEQYGIAAEPNPPSSN